MTTFQTGRKAGVAAVRQMLVNGIEEFQNDAAAFATNLLRVVAVPEGTKDVEEFIKGVASAAAEGWNDYVTPEKSTKRRAS